MKRITAFLLAMVMVLTLVIPFKLKETYSFEIKQNHAGSSPIEDFEIDEDGVLIAYHGEGGDVVIPDGVTSIGNSAFECCDSLTTIIIPEGVTFIGERAFIACRNLERVFIPNTVTRIRSQAFSYCSKLTDINIPESLTAIGLNVFEGSDKVPEIKTSAKIYETGATSNIEWEFDSGELVISGSGYINTSNRAGDVIYGQEYGWGNMWFDSVWGYPYEDLITSVVIEEGITGISSWTFDNCVNIKSVSLPETLKNIGGCAFANCKSLENINLSNVSSVGSQAFYGCEKLADDNGFIIINGELQDYIGKDFIAIVPNTVNKIDSYAFSGENQVKTVLVPSCVNEIGPYAFEKMRVDWEISETTIEYSENVVFEGNMPNFDALNELKESTIWYPYGNDTWKGIEDRVDESVTCKAYKNALCISSADGAVNEEHSYKNGKCIHCNAIDPNYVPSEGGDIFSKDSYLRVYGDNRWKTAPIVAQASAEQFGVEKYDTIIVVNGEKFADALSASYLSYITNAPILLAKDGKTSSAVNYIKDSLNSNGKVYVIGGTGAISDAAMKAVQDAAGTVKGSVTRLFGNNACRTNAAVLEEAKKYETTKPSYAIVCTVENYADALSAGAVGAPIILTKESNGDLYGTQKEYVQSQGFDKVYVFGGTSAVSDSMANKVSALTTFKSFERIAGKNRYLTAEAVAEKFFGAGSGTENVVVAYGENFADALSGGLLAASLKAPLVLAKDGKTSTAANYVKSVPTIKHLAVLGGPTLVTDANVNAIMGTSGVKVVKYE